MLRISHEPVFAFALVTGAQLLAACGQASTSEPVTSSSTAGEGGKASLNAAGAATTNGGAPAISAVGGSQPGVFSSGGDETGGAALAAAGGAALAGAGGAALAAAGGVASGGMGGAALAGGGSTASAGAGAGGSTASTPILSLCPNCRSIFDGTSLSGWVELPAASWSVQNGVMHSLGSARGLVYTSTSYADFRFIFQSRLVKDPAAHLPCVLFWGNSLTKDAPSALQVQPPNGYMWDYRTSGPTANKSPDMYEKRFGHPAMTDTQWSQCEMLGDQATGTMRFACCQVTGTAPCKATEVVDFTDPSAGLEAPLALQVHNAGMIEEFKDLYVESPVSDKTRLLTTQ